ncbi:MAG: Uma2 family endonuclease [Pseudonocardia sp.]|nr:Uma2 family endonuclease [Pseudonocardia sp.]
MTALPLPPQRLPLTVAGYVALGEDPDGVRSELQEGNLVMSPTPVPEHQIAIMRLARQLEDRVPSALELVPDVDIDLQLVAPDRPGTVRAPDLVAVTRKALARRRSEGGVLRAAEVALAVEVISPGSDRMDRVVKRDEYADAGIPHYWIVDLGEPGDRPQLTAHHLAGEFGYADAGPVNGVFAATEPFPVRIDLDALL